MDSTKIWKAKMLDADFLRGRFIDFSYDLHTHDTACLALITDGAIRIRMRGRDFIARKGDLYAIDADEPHAGTPVDGHGWSQRTIYVDLQKLRDRRNDGEACAAPCFLRGPVIRDNHLTLLFQQLHSASELSTPQLAQDEHAVRFGDYLFGRYVDGESPKRPARAEGRAVARAKEFIAHRLDRKLSLASIAAAADLPPFRLYRAFQREVGMTPHDYQRQARIRRSVDLIKKGVPLADIAAATGFVDQAHFTRSFFTRLAITPGVYRDAQLNSD